MNTNANRFQVRAFFAQFPFLTSIQNGAWQGQPDEWCARNGCYETSYHSHPKFICEDDTQDVKVSRVTQDFLGKRTWYEGATGSLVGIRDSEQIFLLGKDGDILTEVKQGRNVTHNEAHWDDEYEEEESIGEALLRLEDPNAVVYAVSVHIGYEFQDHHSVGGYRITVYKAPKGFSLRGWVAEQLRRAEAQLHATIAEIDAEAVTV